MEKEKICKCYNYDFIDYSFKFTKESKKYYVKNEAKNLHNIACGNINTADMLEDKEIYTYYLCSRCKTPSKRVEEGYKLCAKCFDIYLGKKHKCIVILKRQDK
jgi:hypothetical protein